MFGQIGERLSDPLIKLSECFPKMLERARRELTALVVIPAGVGSELSQRMCVCAPRSSAGRVPGRSLHNVHTGLRIPIGDCRVFLFHVKHS